MAIAARNGYDVAHTYAHAECVSMGALSNEVSEPRRERSDRSGVRGALGRDERVMTGADGGAGGVGVKVEPT